MTDAVEPTFDTPLSYQARCGGCGIQIGLSAVYCKGCGVKIAWPDPDDADDRVRKLLTGGDR